MWGELCRTACTSTSGCRPGSSSPPHSPPYSHGFTEVGPLIKKCRELESSPLSLLLAWNYRARSTNKKRRELDSSPLYPVLTWIYWGKSTNKKRRALKSSPLSHVPAWIYGGKSINKSRRQLESSPLSPVLAWIYGGKSTNKKVLRARVLLSRNKKTTFNQSIPKCFGSRLFSSSTINSRGIGIRFTSHLWNAEPDILSRSCIEDLRFKFWGAQTPLVEGI